MIGRKKEPELDKAIDEEIATKEIKHRTAECHSGQGRQESVWRAGRDRGIRSLTSPGVKQPNDGTMTAPGYRPPGLHASS